MLQPYAIEIMPSCPRTERFFTHPERQWHYDYQYLADREMDRHWFYDWLREATGYRYYLAAKLVSRKHWTAAVSLQRTQPLPLLSAQAPRRSSQRRKAGVRL